MSRIGQKVAKVDSVVLEFGVNESKATIELRDIEFVEFKNRMTELKFSSKETNDTWEILSRR